MSLESMPNILILMSDEHRADVAGFAGNTVVRTPTLDALAARGVTFSNAYTPSPVCVPARQCIMAGQYPTTAGLTGWQDLEAGHLTLPRHLSRHAYYTAACGKLHHEGPDQMQGWVHRIGSDTRLSPRHIEKRNAAYFERYTRPFTEYKWSDRTEILRAGPGRAAHTIADEYTVAGAENFIEEYFLSPYYDRELGSHQPLLLKVSLVQPHYPYICDEDLFRYYLNRVEPFSGEDLFDHPFLSQRALQPGAEVSQREVRRATAAYYAMVETVDRHFARVLRALETAGQNLDEWIILYLSDHGEMLGEHGVWEKQKFFEASVRAPLLMSSPTRWPAGIEVSQNVSLTDLFATLCDAVAIDLPSGLDSRSLVPLIESRGSDRTSWSNEVLSMFSKADQPLPREESQAWSKRSIVAEGGSNLMVKRGDLKYQFYGSDTPEVLFDLARDPGERRNALNDPAYAAELAGFRARGRELGYAIADHL